MSQDGILQSEKIEKIVYLLDMTTVAPRSDSILTIPFPKPVPPPVTKATFPLKQPSGSIQSLFTGKYFFSVAECLALNLKRLLFANLQQHLTLERFIFDIISRKFLEDKNVAAILKVTNYLTSLWGRL